MHVPLLRHTHKIHTYIQKIHTHKNMYVHTLPSWFLKLFIEKCLCRKYKSYYWLKKMRFGISRQLFKPTKSCHHTVLTTPLLVWGYFRTTWRFKIAKIIFNYSNSHSVWGPYIAAGGWPELSWECLWCSCPNAFQYHTLKIYLFKAALRYHSFFKLHIHCYSTIEISTVKTFENSNNLPTPKVKGHKWKWQ